MSLLYIFQQYQLSAVISLHYNQLNSTAKLTQVKIRLLLSKSHVHMFWFIISNDRWVHVHHKWSPIRHRFPVSDLLIIYWNKESKGHFNIKRLSYQHIDRLLQERRNSSALAMELCLSCTNPFRDGVTAVLCYASNTAFKNLGQHLVR